MEKYQLGGGLIDPATGAKIIKKPINTPSNYGTLEVLSQMYAEKEIESIVLPEDFGESQYDQEVTIKSQLDNLDEYRANSQGIMDKVGNSVAKFIGFTGAYTVGGVVGSVVGLQEGRDKAATQFKKNVAEDLPTTEIAKGVVSDLFTGFTGNAVFENMTKFTEFTAEKFPHYYTQAEREKDFLDQTLTYNFWGDKFINGVSFLAAAALTEGTILATTSKGGAAVSYAKSLFKGADEISELTRASTTASSIAARASDVGKLSKAATIFRQLITGAGFESSIEARDGYNNVIDNYLSNGVDSRGLLISKRFGKDENLTREEKLARLSKTERTELIKYASSVHNMLFGVNLAVVGIGNVVGLGNLYGAGVMKRINLFNKVGKKVDEVADVALGYKGFLGNTGIDRVKGVTTWAGRAGWEAFEEGSQGVAQRTASNYALKSTLVNSEFVNEQNDFLVSFAEAAEDQFATSEGQTEMFLGLALGAMGMPKKFGGTGMGWSGNIEAEKRARSSQENLNKFQLANLEKLEALSKSNPNFSKNTVLAFVAAENIRSSQEAFNMAVEAGDLATAKSIEVDNSLDIFMAKDLMGDFNTFKKEFYQGLKKSGKDFTESFGYDEMSNSEIDNRKIELKNSFESLVSSYENAVKAVDKVYNLTEEDKYRDISNVRSPAYRRRIMIHAAATAENRDMREKAMTAKVAELIGGNIISKDGLVDNITVDTPDGPRVISLSTMNALGEGIDHKQTVGTQLMETAQRLAALAAVPKRQRADDHDKVVENLEILFKVLKQEVDLSRPLLSLSLENGNNSEIKTLDEWIAQDPLRSKDSEELRKLLGDIRRLRAERHFHASLFQKLTTKEGSQAMTKEMLKLQKDFAESRAETGTKEEKEALKKMNVEELKAKLALYSSDLTIRLDEFIESVQFKKETLRTNLELVDMLQPFMEQLTAKGKKKLRGANRKTLVDPKTGNKMALLTVQEYKALYEKAVQEIPGLERELADIDETVETRIKSTEELKYQLNNLIVTKTPNPEGYEAYLKAKDKVDAFEYLRKALNLPEDFNYDSFTYFSENEEDVRVSFKEALTLMDDGIESMALGVMAATAELDSYKALLEGHRKAMASVDLLEVADTDENIKATVENLEELLKVANENLAEAQARKKELEKNYNTIRRLQAYMKAMAWDASTAHKDALESVELDLESVISANILDTSYTPATGDARFLPDIAQNKNGFLKTTGDNAYNLKEYIKLSQKTSLTDNEKKGLKQAKDQVIWYDWLSKSESGKGNPLNPFVKILLITEKSLAHPGIPESLRSVLTGTFEGEEDVKAVIVKTNKEDGQNTWEAVTHQGGIVYTSLMTPKLLTDSGEERFTNKLGTPRTEAEKKGISDEYRAWKNIVLSASEPRFVPITGKSNGTVVVNKAPDAPLLFSDTAVMYGVGVKNTKLMAAVKLTKAEVATGKNLKPSPKSPSVWSKLGMVWAYDHVRAVLVPSERQRLSASTALTVSRLLQLQLKTIKEYNDQGESLGNAVKRSKLLTLVSTKIDDPISVEANKASKKKEKPAIKQIDVEITLQDHLNDLVILTSSAGPYTLDVRIEGKESVIIYGSNPVDGKPYTMSLADFAVPASQKKFLEFLQTKFHQANANTIDNAMAEEFSEYKGKGGKPEKRSENKFKPLTPWVKVSIAEDLRINPIQPSTVFHSYNHYLLTPSAKEEKAPIMFKTMPFKNVLAVQRTQGGYLTFGKGLNQTGQVAVPFSTFSYKADTKNATTEIKATPGVAPVSLTSPTAEDLGSNWLQSTSEEVEENPFQNNEVPTTENIEGEVPPSTEEDEIAAQIAAAGNLVIQNPNLELLTPTTNTPGTVQNVETPVSRENTLHENILAIPELFKTLKAENILETLNIGGEVSTLSVPSITITVSGKTVVIANYETVEATKENPSGIELTFLREDPVPGKLKEEILKRIAEAAEMPFLNLFQANNPRVLQILETIDEEKARVLKMTPLSIVDSQILITSLSTEGVAQLTDYGKVLISKFAPGGALYHEAFHNISLYVLSPKDSKYLYDKVRAIPGSITTYQGETKKLSELSNKEAEEWLAEEFRYYLLDPSYKVAKTSVTDTRSAIKRFFDYLKTTIRRFTKTNESFEFDKDLNSIEGLFKAIEGGKFLNASRHSEKGYAGIYGMSLKDAGLTVKFQRDLVDIFIAEIGNAVDGDRIDMNLEDLYIGMTLKEEESRVKALYTRAFFDLREKLLAKESEFLRVTEGKERPIEEAVPYTPAVVPQDASTKTPIEGLNERLNAYGNANVVLPSNFNEGVRPVGRLNSFKSSIASVANNLQILADLNLNEFNFLSTEDKKRLDALKPLAKELKKVNISDISSADRRTVAVEKRYAQLTNQLANEFVDIVGKHVEQQLGKKITTSSPVLGKQPAAKKKPSSELALNFMKLDAVQAYLKITGRSINERGNPAILKELADKHFAEMKFKEPKEATDEEGKTKDIYDREVHTEGPINTAESAIRLLLGGITDESSMTTASLPGTYPLSLQKIHGGKSVHGIFKVLQDWCMNSTSLDQIIKTIKEKDEIYIPRTRTKKYPWVSTVLRRLEHLRSIDDTQIVGMDLTATAKHNMLISITAQLTKANQPPMLTLLQQQGTELGVYNRISILNPTDEAEVTAITNEWKNNLITLVNKGQAKYVKIVNNVFQFDSSVPIIPNSPNSKLVNVSSLVGKASIREIIDYLKPLGIVFSNEEKLINAFEEINEEGEIEEDFEALQELRENLGNIFSGLSSPLTSSGASVNLYSRNTSETASRMRKIVELEDKYGDRIKNASSHIHGKVEYDITEGNTLTLIANSVLSDLAHLNPARVPYSRNSLTVAAQAEKIKAGEAHALPVYRSIGLREDKSGETGAKTNKLEVPEILAEKIRTIQEGFSPLPPAADKNTVLNVALGIWEPLSNKAGKVTYEKSEKALLNYLEDEILASVVGMRELSYIKNYEANIQKLRYFAGIVGAKNNSLVENYLKDSKETDKIYKEFKETQKSPTLEAFMVKNKNAFTESIKSYVAESGKRLKEDLIYNHLIRLDDKGGIHVTGLDALVINAGTTNKTSFIKESQFEGVLEDLVLRQIISNNEIFKIVLGDPAFFSDLLKRVGGAPGPKTLGSTDPDSIAFYGKDAIEKGYVSETGIINGLTIEEPIFINKTVLEDLNAELQKSYEGPIDMSDGSILVLPEVYRFLEGMTNQWGFEKETMYHRLMDSKTPEGEKFKSIYGGTLSPSKPQYYGPALKEGQYVVSAFLKMAVFPIDDSMNTINGVKYKNIDTILKFMRENNTGFLVLPSAQKVGGVDPKQGILPKINEVIYQATGEIVFIPGKKGKVDPRAFTGFDIKYFGAQLKTNAEAKKNTATATQARVQMYADLYENGEVSEYMFPNPERRAEIETLLDDYTETLNLLTTKSTKKLLENLKIPYVQDELTGEWGYKMNKSSYEQILKVLEDSGSDNSLGEQIMEGIEYFKTLDEFKFEHFVAGPRIEKMLASHMEGKVTRAKYKGAGLILASNLGYEFSEIENQDGSTTIVDKRLKLGLNKETNAYELEVFLPHYFEEFFGVDMRITNDGIIDPSTGKIFPGSDGLLNMIGIRIPTDGLHSIDVIRVKGFLHQIMGPRVVVPELLVKKAGSDFDVDKLTTYFQSYKVIGGKLVREQMRTVEEYFNQKLKQSESGLYTEEELLEFEEDVESAEDILKRREAIKNKNAAVISNTIERLTNEEYIKYHDQYGAISFETWLSENPTTIADINTTGALQNHIMDVMSKLIQLPERKEALMSPVNTDTAAKVSKELLEAHNITGNRYKIPTLSNKDAVEEVDENGKKLPKKAIPLSDSLGIGEVSRVQYAYWEGKSVTAIAAVFSTFKIKAQVAGLQLAPNLFGTVDGSSVFVKYNFAETENFDKDAPVDLGGILDLNLVEKDRVRITSINSESVNTAVDTVNTPYLHILNMGIRNASAGLALINIGVPLKSVSALFNQPIVKIFTHELNISKGRVFKAFNEPIYEKEVMANAIKAIYDSGEVLPQENTTFFTYEQLIEMIKIPLEDMTPIQRGHQLQILQDFRGYTVLGNIVTSLMSTQSFDTKPPRGKVDIMLRNKMYQDMLDKKQFINAEKITESGKFFISELKKFTLETPKILQDLSESNKYGELYESVMEMAMNEVLLPDVFMSYDDKLDSLERVDQLFTTMLFQRTPVEGVSVGDHAQRLLYGKASISQQLLQIAETPSHPLYENFYIHHLRPIIQTAPMLNKIGKIALAPDYVQAQVRGLSELDQSMLNEAFKEIEKYDIETGGRLAQDIIDTALLQAGVLTSPFSFLDTVSGESFAKKAKSILDAYNGDSNNIGVIGESDFNQRPKNVLSMMVATGLLKAIVAKDSSSKRKTHMFTQKYTKLNEASADGKAQFAMEVFRIDHIQGFADVIHKLNLTNRTDATFLNFTDAIFDLSRTTEYPIKTNCP